MKFKQILLFTLCVTIFSCSTEKIDNPEKEKETEETNDSTLLTKIIDTDSEGDSFTTNFIYDGNKLMTINNDWGDKNTFHLFDFVEDKIAYKNVLTYNNDNTIKQDVYTGDFDSQTSFSYTYIITLENDNIKSIVDSPDSYNYEYDNKKGIYKNIFAIDIINIVNDTEFGYLFYGNKNNATKKLDIEGSYEYKETYEYTYNENDYPKSAIYTYTSDDAFGEPEEEVYNIEYFYEL